MRRLKQVYLYKLYNLCLSLLRKEKQYFANLNKRNITDNRKF